MYGPPPDPRQVEVLPQPGDHAIAIALGLGITALFLVKRLPEWARWAAFVLGQTVTLTSPLAALLTRAVYGAFPTIDKAGSLLFYEDGVHRRLTLHPLDSLQDPAARLIGVHVGHLWISAFFDLFVGPSWAAFNVQALLLPALGWFAAAAFIREVRGEGSDWKTAIFLGFPFGMGLHVFRDLNWYTIEKSAVGFLALFAWAMARRRPALAALTFFACAFVNWYLALVGAAGVALAVILYRDRAFFLSACAAAAAALPLVALQLALLKGPKTLGDPEAFLRERAMLDVFSLLPPAWNRLEAWRALNLPWLALAFWGLRERRSWPLAAVGAFLFLLALGPMPVEGIWNPLYMGIREVVPGFWRVAKPEVFFEGAYLAALGMAGIALRERELPAWVWPLLATGWLLVVRTHPVFPGFSEPLELHLPSDWAERMGL